VFGRVLADDLDIGFLLSAGLLDSRPPLGSLLLGLFPAAVRAKLRVADSNRPEFLVNGPAEPDDAAVLGTPNAANARTGVRNMNADTDLIFEDNIDTMITITRTATLNVRSIQSYTNSTVLIPTVIFRLRYLVYSAFANQYHLPDPTSHSHSRIQHRILTLGSTNTRYHSLLYKPSIYI
jgi:hypothetical protein